VFTTRRYTNPSLPLPLLLPLPFGAEDVLDDIEVKLSKYELHISVLQLCQLYMYFYYRFDAELSR